jgi:type VI secretion system protein VasD
MRSGTRLARGIKLLYLLGVASCASAQRQEGPLPPVEITVEASARLNPDEDGQSLPTSIRLYQLRSPGRLEAAEFDQLYRREKEILADDLLHVDEVTVSPGEKVRKQLVREPGARALAAVAVVRRPSGTAWRAVVELPPGSSAPIVFAVEDFRVTRR